MAEVCDHDRVPQDMETGVPPEDYRERVVTAKEEICARLEAEGFRARQGEIEAVWGPGPTRPVPLGGEVGYTGTGRGGSNE
ncbi:MAG: hypothetical protein H5T97_09540, partial [Firmicutes bacterium]|nr:hypothetical protein [Bacillota bacterium]